MASTAVFTVLVAVSITTGRAGWRPRMASRSCSPSIPGITMSRRTRSNGPAASWLSASGAELDGDGLVRVLQQDTERLADSGLVVHDEHPSDRLLGLLHVILHPPAGR